MPQPTTAPSTPTDAATSTTGDEELRVQDPEATPTTATAPPPTETTSVSNPPTTGRADAEPPTTSTPTTPTEPPMTTAIPAPSAGSGPRRLSVGASSFQLDIGGGREVTVRYYAADVDLASARIVIAMHGASRNAEGALNAWTAIADEHGLIVAVPELTKDIFPGDAYNLGGTLAGDQLTPSSAWGFPIVEQVFDCIVEATDSSQRTYVLYGHSAGAQFVERFALLWRPNRVSQFVAAGAGWYTMVDELIDYPYGLRGGPPSAAQARAAFGSPFLVLVGELDTDASAEDLRQTPGAQAQGSNRRDRGTNFFDHAAATAAALGSPFDWHFAVVPGAGHENRPMAAEVARILFL